MKNFSLIALLLCLSCSISKAQFYPDTSLTCCVVGVESDEDVFVFPDIPGLGAYNVYFIDSVSGPNPYVFTMSDGDSVPVSIYSGYTELDTYHAYIGTNDTTFHYTLSEVKFIQRPRICLATVDSLQQIEIKLEYVTNVGYADVEIYRYTTVLNTEFVGTIDTSGLVLVDSTVNALTTSYKYEARVDGCPVSEGRKC